MTSNRNYMTKLDCKSREEIKNKHRSWRKFMRNKQKETYLQYCKSRNRVRKITRNAQKSFERDIAKSIKSNPKKFWRYVKSKSKVKSKVTELEVFDSDGNFSIGLPSTTQKKQIHFQLFFKVSTL